MDPPGTALIIGATSDIGRAIGRALAHDGWALQLAARDAARLVHEAADLALRGAGEVAQRRCDVLEEGAAAALAGTLEQLPDIAICVVGELGEQPAGERDSTAAERVMRTNYIGPALLLGALAERFEARGSGVLVALSSVAGERGRAANYLYGSAKAGLTAFLSGLRNRLHPSGVRVVTVIPGFVATRMTDGMALPSLLTATPEAVAKQVVGAIRRGKDVVYAGPLWRFVSAVLRALPEAAFKRLRL